MSLFMRSNPSAQPTYADDPTRLELWVPDRLAAEFKPAHTLVSASVTPLTHRNWADGLESTLSEHVGAALAAIQYGGVRPGRRPYPNVPVSGSTLRAVPPTRTGIGERSTLDGIGLMKWVEEGPSDAVNEAIRAWREDQMRVPEFEAQVEAVCAAVLADPDRAWVAYLHLRAIDAAEVEVSARERAASELRRRESAETCPICMEFNPDSHPIMIARYLDTGEPVRQVAGVLGTPVAARRASVVRGHAECVAAVLRVAEERAALAVLTDGRTRAVHAAEWLDNNK